MRAWIIAPCYTAGSALINARSEAILLAKDDVDQIDFLPLQPAHSPFNRPILCIRLR